MDCTKSFVLDPYQTTRISMGSKIYPYPWCFQNLEISLTITYDGSLGLVIHLPGRRTFFFFFRGSFDCKGPFLQPLLVEFIPRATRWDELPWLARMAHFEREKTWCWFKTSWKIRYTQVNEHSNGKWTHWLEDVFPIENGDIHSYVSLPEGMSNQMITSEIWLFEPKNHPNWKENHLPSTSIFGFHVRCPGCRIQFLCFFCNLPRPYCWYWKWFMNAGKKFSLIQPIYNFQILNRVGFSPTT